MSGSPLREAVILLVVSILLGLAYNAITGKGIFGPTTPPSTTTPADGSTTSSEIISLEQAKQLFDAADALFIDTRHAFDFQLDHIPGALNIPLKEAETLVSSFTEPRDRTIVVYCDGAECNSSLEVGALFIMQGYSDVRIFFSGWRSWKDMGYEMEGTGL